MKWSKGETERLNAITLKLINVVRQKNFHRYQKLKLCVTALNADSSWAENLTAIQKLIQSVLTSGSAAKIQSTFQKLPQIGKWVSLQTQTIHMVKLSSHNDGAEHSSLLGCNTVLLSD
jgi:hypothetical protein